MSIEMNDNLRRAMHRPTTLRQPSEKLAAEVLPKPGTPIAAPQSPLAGVLSSCVGQYAKKEPEREIRQIYETDPYCPLSNPKPQRHQAAALGSSGEGEKEVLARITVRFTGYRVRPLDPDNFAGSVKDLLDGLRHANLIDGDEPWKIRLETEQVKVSSFKEERTEITVEYPTTP